jgi:3'-phosphoadenosine 5'-phosphosulfate sulfotransferase (PAPS reductase)/FAD synthetase
MNAPALIEHLLPGLDHQHLDALEEEAIFILREVAAAFERPALLFSGGKDSCVVLRLAEKAFKRSLGAGDFAGQLPFPLLHVDTGHNFPEVIAFRDDMVITDLVARHGLGIELATLQTGRLHAQTLALIPAIERHYRLRVRSFEPLAEAAVRFVRTHGELAMRQSVALRTACCQIRKLEPLGRLLDGRSAWVTGLRREQSGARAEVRFEELQASGRLKLKPLADWSATDVW